VTKGLRARPFGVQFEGPTLLLELLDALGLGPPEPAVLGTGPASLLAAPPLCVGLLLPAVALTLCVGTAPPLAEALLLIVGLPALCVGLATLPGALLLCMGLLTPPDALPLCARPLVTLGTPLPFRFSGVASEQAMAKGNAVTSTKRRRRE